MSEEIQNQERKIRRRVLLPLGITLVVFLALFLSVFQVYLQRELSRQLENNISSVLTLYNGILEERSNDMLTVLEVIAKNKALQQAMIARDREKLQDLAAPIYRDLQKHQSFTHFYFHSIDSTNFLRVHKPERFGDKINRLTMVQARSAIQPDSGAELGPLGTFTLRTVFPWFADEKLIGFIELGEEVEPLLELVTAQSKSHMAILIKKNLLSHESWQEGREMLGRSSSWNLLPDYVVTATTDNQLLQVLPNFGARDFLSGDEKVEVKLQRNRYQGGFLALIDASGQQVGATLILQDVDEALENHGFATALVTIFCILLGSALFFSAYTILGRAEHALAETQLKLINEIEKTHEANTQLGLEIGEKRAAEQALQRAHDELEKRVVARTSELDQQRKLMENLVSNIPAYVAWKDLDRKYIGSNNGYARLAGSSEDEIVGKTDADLDWSAMLSLHLSAIDEEVMTENRIVLGREVKDEKCDGGSCYLCNAVPLKNEDGHVFGMVSILQDISEQKEKQQLLEETLLESRKASDRISGVMRSVDDALFVVDANDNILLMNESAGVLLRLNPEDVIGRNVGSAIWLESLRNKVLEALRKREGNVQFDFEVGQKDQGSVLVMQARSSVLIDPHGRYEGMIFLARDVTRDRSMDRMKSVFISVAAHELRTPMATILGFTELLIDGRVESEEDRQDFIRKIYDKADALSRLLDDMLDISRIESGHGLELFIDKVAVETLFMPVLKQYQKRVENRQIEIDLDDPELLLLADPEKIAQVMENLLSNAVKYSQEDSKISIFGKTTVGGYRLSIHDSGIGMTPEQASHAFDKFYRGDNTDKAIKGTGLGLTIVKHIVDEHNGRIKIESRPGKGTRVHVLLPIA